MLNTIRTDSDNPDFVALVRLLDAELAERDGQEHGFYAQFNKIDRIRHVVVAYVDDQPAGCGALKAYTPGVLEVKRMFTLPTQRRLGVASAVLGALEAWAAELGAQKCILETGIRQPEAIGLYTRLGYQRIPNYGQYAGVENSVCFEKNLV